MNGETTTHATTDHATGGPTQGQIESSEAVEPEAGGIPCSDRYWVQFRRSMSRRTKDVYLSLRSCGLPLELAGPMASGWRRGMACEVCAPYVHLPGLPPSPPATCRGDQMPEVLYVESVLAEVQMSAPTDVRALAAATA